MPRGSRASFLVAFLQLQPLLCARDGAQSRDWAVAESGSAFGPSWDPSLLVPLQDGEEGEEQGRESPAGARAGAEPPARPRGAAQTPLNPPLVPPHVPNPQPLRAIPTLLSHPSCSVFSPHSSVHILRLSQLIFIPLERIMGSTSCLSSPQRVLPSLHGQDKPHSAN